MTIFPLTDWKQTERVLATSSEQTCLSKERGQLGLDELLLLLFLGHGQHPG